MALRAYLDSTEIHGNKVAKLTDVSQLGSWKTEHCESFFSLFRIVQGVDGRKNAIKPEYLKAARRHIPFLASLPLFTLA